MKIYTKFEEIKYFLLYIPIVFDYLTFRQPVLCHLPRC